MREPNKWWREINTRSILRTYVQLKGKPESLIREEYLTLPHGGWNDRRLKGRHILTQLRCGSSQLRINQGRWNGLSVGERICQVCAEEAETERHFILVCSAYQDKRKLLFDKISKVISHHMITNKNDNDKEDQVGFNVCDLPSEVQFLLILTGTHPCVRNQNTTRSILAYVMEAINDWFNIRQQLLDVADAMDINV